MRPIDSVVVTPAPSPVHRAAVAREARFLRLSSRLSSRVSFLTLTLSVSLALPTAINAPAQAQPVGLPSMGATSGAELSPMLERKLGEAIMVQGRRDPTYIDDPELRQYLRAMGRRLAAHAPGGGVAELDVFGVRDAAINAFAMPGGYIGIHSGLIVASETEAELAGVLAHEIGHVAQRHIARGFTQQGQNSGLMMASMAAALIAALAGGGADLATGVATFGQAAAVSRQLGFSRDAEREADRAGFDMMARAGYDPAGMARMFGRLMNASRLNDGLGGGTYATTHPLSIQRLSDIQGRLNARAAPASGSANQGSDDFWFIRAKLRVLQAGDSQGQRAVAQQLRAETKAATSVARRTAAHYGLALSALARNSLHEAGAALASARRQANADGHDFPYLAALEVRIATAASDLQQALALARAAWRQWPDHRALAFALAESLQRAGLDAEAVVFLRETAARWGESEPRLLQLLAQSEERAAQPIAARLSMASYYERIGALPAAVSQLNQARGLSKDFYQQAQIDVRIRDLKTRMDEDRALLARFR